MSARVRSLPALVRNRSPTGWGCAFVEGVGVVAEPGGVAVGTDDAAAAGDALVEAGRVPDAVTVAERLGSFVVAEQEGFGVVVDHGVFVGEESAGGQRGDPGAGAARGAGGGF